MQRAVKFYHCEVCGRVLESITDGGPLTCCGKPMTLLAANTVDAAKEKHVPDVTREGNTLKIQIGSVAHPMIESHFIQFIAVVQGAKTQRVNLHSGDSPVATFTIDDGAADVYEFCNLHGLWVTNI